MATTEPTINDALAEVLALTRSLWRVKGVVRSENTGVLIGAGKKPDILVVEPNVSPVVIETEVMPAATVEADAVQRLGQQLSATGQPILSALAVRMPGRLRNHSGAVLKQELADAGDFDVAIFTGSSPEKANRWPRSGWLQATPLDMSILVQHAAVPPEVVTSAANRLVSGVTEAAGLLDGLAAAHPAAPQGIGRELRQRDGPQTRKMAMAILANAFVFQETVAHGPDRLADVRTHAELRALDGGMGKGAVIAEWEKILAVNYWPIFEIAKHILNLIPADSVSPLIDKLSKTADQLLEDRLMRSHDLTGAVFQQLIADRKFLAAYYTTPAAAALLVGLAILPDRTPAGGSWSDPGQVTALRIADFACGTGTLLSTAYQRISQLHEAAGGDAEATHPAMMASVLVGCDVLPAAAHLTASMLAGAHPTVRYKETSVLTVDYGRHPGERISRVALGSLDLLNEQRAFDALDLTGRFEVVKGAKAIGGTGQSQRDIWVSLPHWSFDLVLMNPPFTRDTGQEAGKVGVPNPMFAAFGTSKREQRIMARAMDQLLQRTSYHGNAGEASAFFVLADRKLKPNGTLALVMPLSLMLGEAWKATRQSLRKSYSDLILVSVAGARSDELSFSADTDMGECLLVAKNAAQGSKRATFVVLNKRPEAPIVGATAAAQILGGISGGLRRLEDGPVGGTTLYFGNEPLGWALDAPLPSQGSWKLARIADAALAQAAFQMTDNGLIWLPGTPESDAVPISVKALGAIWARGPVYHMDINANTPTGGIRGPFEVRPVLPGGAPTYPVLWSHAADRERSFQFEADSEGIIRRGADQTKEAAVRTKAAKVWATASHCHFNRDFQFNSQATGMQFTARKTIGGRAWPSISLQNEDQERALTAWGNSSFGLLLHWWHANKQQSGRGTSGIQSLESLPVLDVTTLKPSVLKQAVAIFEDLKHRDLRPINEIGDDPVRRELDERLGKEVLGLPPGLVGALALLRKKLAIEPSIAGGKGSGSTESSTTEDEQD